MTKIKYSLLLIPAFVLLTLAFAFRENKQNETLLSQAIVEVLENYHFEPKKIDDNFSKSLFKQYLKRLDDDKRFFLKSDIDGLKQYETDLDDQARRGTYEYFDKVNKAYSERIDMISKWYIEELAKPFDFKSKEYFDFNDDSADYLNTPKELHEFWRKSLKQQVLQKLARKLDVQEKALEKKDTFVKVKPYDSLEAESRAEVLKTHNDWFERLRKFDRGDKLSIYMNCITEIFDPHTNYFPKQDKENFDIRMSGKLEGIGAQLQEKDGFLKVVAIVPGSPSYKQGDLKAGDIILKVAQGNDEPVEVTNMKIDDAIQLIRGKKGTEVRLTVKKPDETIVIVPIVRDVVIMEDSYAKSAIIERDGKKYGYINLPTFYLDMNDRNGRSCSKDIELEIEKLKKDRIKGIILDLRNNGGGSLQDVVDMGGLFIEEGPISLVKSRDRKPEVLGDRDGKVLWKGPLTIMVNENSASASEILAAAMQDYKRAAIIGTPTYGKGTVQRFIDLDNAFNSVEADRLGSLKITIQKFYRINGTTTQLVGVTPDIMLPDRYKYLEYGEKENEFALKADKIEQADYAINDNWEKSIQKAQKLSAERVAESNLFNEIERMAVKIGKQNKKSRYTLNLEEYRAEMKALEEDNKKYDEMIKGIEAFTVINTSDDDKALGNDETKVKVKKIGTNLSKKTSTFKKQFMF
ncbi:MAG: carboxy terminal-processing peptidase [Bacteroidia bacterium]